LQFTEIVFAETAIEQLMKPARDRNLLELKFLKALAGA
jgi:hypothetical protein